MESRLNREHYGLYGIVSKIIKFSKKKSMCSLGVIESQEKKKTFFP
jgi:hypothetical protein